ncbi:MAG: putative TetR-family transcriptional repressor [Thermoleophilia bacterium]|nr:putative TetR-family transcriptional repressor [Thermoleophilia bacterium]
MSDSTDTVIPATSPLSSRKPRVREIVAVAREVLEAGGSVDSVSMHRIAKILGIRTPSLYKHVASKREIEQMLVIVGLWEQGSFAHAALDGADEDDRRRVLTDAYRVWARANPVLYSLMNAGPLATDADTRAAAEHGIAAVLRVYPLGSQAARLFWVKAHGLVSLELNERIPSEWDIDELWRTISCDAADE